MSAMDLPGAEVGKVHLRFAPEPSGFLHIGHAKCALLNLYFAQKYEGNLTVRIDDTNPKKECLEFVDGILKDIQTLGISCDTISFTSDYFDKLMQMATKLISEGKAYVDDTPNDQKERERKDRIESKCRFNSVEDNLRLWQEMQLGSERGKQCCIRGKLDMHDPNKCLRDPVYFRCIAEPHPRVGGKYKAYPTYDFACPFVDSIQGITHALRSSEYHDRNHQYHRIQQDMGLPKVQIFEFSRLNMVYTVLSKRRLKWFVEKGKVDGWNDPRLPTVQGVVRRGLQIEALSKFVREQGASTNLNLMEWDKLWTINKKIIDPVCPRHTAIKQDRPVLFTLLNGPEKPFHRSIPRHKKYEGAGEKTTTYTKRVWIEQDDAKYVSLHEEITLMDWGNAVVKDVEKDPDGNVTQITGVLHLEGSVKSTKRKLTWLPETNDLVNLTLVDFKHLLKEKTLKNKHGKRKVKDVHDDTDFLNAVNPSTKSSIAAVGDSNMRYLKQGEVVQLERKGYYKCDVPFVRPSESVILFSIPDGRQHDWPEKTRQGC